MTKVRAARSIFDAVCDLLTECGNPDGERARNALDGVGELLAPGVEDASAGDFVGGLAKVVVAHRARNAEGVDLGGIAAPGGRAPKGTPTSLNLYTLRRYFEGRDEAPARADSVTAPGLIRCARAGLLEVVPGDKTKVRLTEAGRAALAAGVEGDGMDAPRVNRKRWAGVSSEAIFEAVEAAASPEEVRALVDTIPGKQALAAVAWNDKQTEMFVKSGELSADDARAMLRDHWHESRGADVVKPF